MRYLLISLSLALTSCGPWPFGKPTDDLSIRTPGSWSEVSKGNERKISSGWLSEFNDPALTKTVDEALKHNNNLKIASARLKQAKEDAIIGSSRLYPSVDLSNTATVTDRTNAATTRNYGLSLAASWEIDLWGRLRNRSRAADAELKAAIEDYRGARLSLAANTAKAWCNLISAEQELELAKLTLESFEKNLRIIERNYKGTGEGALDIQFGRNNVSSAKRALKSRELDLKEAARGLEVLLGRYPEGTTRNGRELPKLARNVPAGIPAQLLERRPDLAAARARLFASAQRSAASQKALLPSITITGTSGTSTPSFSDLLDMDLLINTLRAAFTQSLTEGGALAAEARASLARNEEQLHRYAQTALVAFQEVESTLAADDSLREQETFLASELKQAELAETLAEREYTEGINPNILSVLEAQRRANNARAAMIRLQNRRLQNRIDLHLALGGDFKTQQTPKKAPKN